MSRPRYRDPLDPLADPKLVVPDPLKVRVKSTNWDGTGTVTGEDTTATAGYFLDATTGIAQFEKVYGNIAVGMLAYSFITSEQVGITSITDVSGLSVTWTAVANRLYKLTAFLRMYQITGTANTDVRITTSGNTSVAESRMRQSTTEEFAHNVVAVVDGLSGSTTYKVRAQTSTGSCTAAADSAGPGWLMVEDVGPQI